MAKKKAASGKVSKSQAIRDYKANNSAAKPKAISEALSAEGYSVTPQYVSMILSNDRRKSDKPKAARGRAAAPATRRPSASPAKANVSVDDLMKAKQLVEAFGSVDKARASLDAYSKVVG